MRGGVKQIQLPHANGWLTMVKSQSPALYDRVAKLLEAWERDEQDKSCYQKFMEVLKNEPALLEALNIYVEEDVHFKVVKPQQQQTAIEEYMQDLKLNNKKTFLKAYNKLNQLHNEGTLVSTQGSTTTTRSSRSSFKPSGTSPRCTAGCSRSA